MHVAETRRREEDHEERGERMSLLDTYLHALSVPRGGNTENRWPQWIRSRR
jgi:hypothetical protein